MTTSPFFTLWVQPRDTMRNLLEREHSGWIPWLAILAGISQVFFEALQDELGNEMALLPIIGLALFGGAIGGLISLYLSTFLLRWTGRWFGGRDEFYSIKAAVGWSSLPVACSLLLWFILLPVFGSELFASSLFERGEGGMAIYLFVACIGLQMVLAIWGAFLLVKCLAEAQGFSSWRALVNIAVAFLILITPFALIGLFSGHS